MQAHPPDREAATGVARQSRSAVLLAIAAAVLAIGLPPAGFGLGVAAAVLALRSRGAPPLRWVGLSPTVLSLAGAGVGIVVGGVLTVGSVVLGTELSRLRECMAGANTRVAEQRCQDEFTDALDQRFRGARAHFDNETGEQI